MADKRGRIFLSYRRADSAAVVDHLYGRLVAKYGKKCVFRDIDNIPIGVDFRTHIRGVLDDCDIVLAVVGKSWSGGKGSAARIMRDNDLVRIEIEEGMKARSLVVPVLVNGAKMPSAAELPPSLEEFRARNAAVLGSGIDFEHHLASLFGKLDAYLKQCGKTVVPRPDWLTPAVAATATLAVAPPILFAASALFGIPFSGGVVTVGVFVMALAAALATALFAVDAFLSGRIGWSQPQQRPVMAGALLFLLATPAWYWAGDRLAAAIPVRDPDHLSKQLLASFSAAKETLRETGRSDFATPTEIVRTLRNIDPENGTAWYYAGEIKRRGNPDLFDTESCFKGWPEGEPGPHNSLQRLKAYQSDFERYRDNAPNLGGAAMNTWDVSACYEGNGYCGQRFAFVHHLMAYDYFVAAKSESGATRIALLTAADNALDQALQFQRPEGGDGFNQCEDDSVLKREVEAALAEAGPG